jgi:hypothetical protein
MTFPILPKQKDLYEALVSGKHLCLEDGDIFATLHDHEDDYRTLFSGLGMTLVGDPRGFFYLDGTRTPANMKDILFFMAIFFESLDEQGYALEDAVLQGTFRYSELPHLKHQRYADVMERAAGVKDAEGLKQIVGSMARYRFVVTEGADAFRFRTPAYRLFDLMRDAKNVMDHAAEQSDPADQDAGEGA